ncbi:hypothetical protein [Serratia fonticola]|uniref:hypothetical protein n=1 Tax=Serratia fonticola TaxID=47917 RepID=UPI001FBABF09|nr:hypothetical protein [Serratia fonticola]
MVNSNTAFSHHFFEIAQAKGISQIPTNTLRDNIDGVMQAFKGISDQRSLIGNITKKTACYLTPP